MPPAAPLGAFGLIWFCYFGAMGTYTPFAPLWFKELGFSTLLIGAIASAQAWTRVLAPYAWGWLGDHSGSRVRLLRLSAGLSLLAAGGLLWSRSPLAVTACVVLLFLANGGVVPLAEATLARHLQTAQGGLDSGRYGRVRMWGSAGFIASVILLGLAFQYGGILLFAWLVPLTWGLLLAATLRLHASSDPPVAHEAAPPVWQVLRRPVVAWTFVSIFFTVLAHTGLYAFFSLFLDEQGHGKSVVGMLWAVSIAMEIVFFWWQGRFFARFAVHAWLQVAALAAMLRFAGTAAFGAHLAVLVLLQLLHALSFAAHHAACIACVNQYFAGALRARGQALYTVLGYGCPGVIGGVAGGWLGERLGFGSVFWAATAAAAVAWACARHARKLAAAT